MDRRHATMFAVALAGVALLFTVAPAGASRLDYLQAQEITPFRLMSGGGFFDLGLLHVRDRRQDRAGSRPLKTTETGFLEGVGVNGEGYVYHPLLLEWKGGAVFDLTQDRSTSNGEETGAGGGSFESYILSAKIMQRKPATLTLTATSQVVETHARFAPVQRTRNDYRRGWLRYRHRLFPTEVTYEQRRFRGMENSGTNETDDKLTVESRNDTLLGTTGVSYMHEERTQGASGLGARGDGASLTNGVRPWGGASLTSGATWQVQGGTHQSRGLGVNVHLDTLLGYGVRSHWGYQWNHLRRRFPGPQVAAQGSQEEGHTHYEGGLDYKLYQSLFTNLQVTKDRERIDTGFDDTTSGNLSVRYTKRIAKGRLTLTYHLRRRRDDQDFSGSRTQVVGEGHQFGELPEGGDVITLRHVMVAPESVTLEDTAGLPLLDPTTGEAVAEGVEYRLETVGTITKVRLLAPLGDFLIGREVAVSYLFQALPPLTADSTSTSYGLNWSWENTWRLFARTGHTNGTLRKGEDLGRIDDTQDRSFGGELHLGPSTTHAERTIHHSRLTPYTRSSLREQIIFTPFGEADLVVNGEYQRAREGLDVEPTSSYMVSGRLDWPLSETLRLETVVLYRNATLVGNHLVSWNTSNHLTWQYRNLDFDMNYVYRRQVDRLAGLDSGHRVTMHVRRYFGGRS